MAGLVVAGLSVRALAESARDGGFEVAGLDLFGDRDTRAACRHWQGIGADGSLRIDPVLFEAALAGLAAEGRFIGWVPGGGFEDELALLEAGGDALPCLGMALVEVRRVRTPRSFFGALDRLGIAHPETVFVPPAAPARWLAKRAGGCGGAQVRHAPAAVAHDSYWQRLQAGTPMSALFLADGARSLVVGLNEQLVEATDDRPFMYAGAIGPVQAPGALAEVEAMLARLVPEFGLRGLASLDFIADGTALHVLEINPRPSASMQLHADAVPGGLVRAHLDALGGRLPALAPRTLLRGHRIVFARAAVDIDDALSHALAELGGHDIPVRGTHVRAGAPVCSVSAGAGGEPALRSLLAQRMAAVQALVARECMA